jgi:RNA polymerase sigma-70 factor (ECF subfamily)
MTLPGDPGTVLPPSNDLAAAMEGDHAAARRVLAALYPVAVRYCRGRLGPGAAAEEAAQEIVARVDTMLTRSEGTRPGPGAVYRIAREVVDRRVVPPLEADVAPRVTGGPALRPCRVLRLVSDAPLRPRRGSAMSPAMSARLAVLPVELREVLVLRVAAGLPVADVAAMLDLTQEAVRVMQHRAVVRLRELTADSGVA